MLAQTRDTSYFIYQNLGPNVNSDYNESGPRISPDGAMLYYFRVDHPEDMKGSNDIWLSKLTNDSLWSMAERLPEPLNNYSDNAVHSISEDGKKLLVHDIYLSNKTSKSGLSITTQKPDGTWAFPEPLKIKKYKNKNNICSFYLSDDWETLILAIETDDTQGKQDLYVSFHNKEKDSWSTPLNIGKTINTSGAEATPYLGTDQKTLYFSTDGISGGLGGFDIYKSTRLDDSWTNWSTPENLGAPYNTADDEFYFSTPSHANGWVYLAHSHHHGHSDITRIKKVTEPIPDPINTLHGYVYDNISKKTLKATIKFIEIETTNKELAQADTNKEYLIALNGYKTYTYSIEVEGYETLTGKIDPLKILKASDTKRDFYLTPIPQVEPIVIKGLEFNTAKWDILPKYIPELEKALGYLNANPKLRFSVVGHTDNIDTDEYNKTLSENRAKAVKEYFVKRGINPERLESAGYGESKPVDTNDTESGRQKNRRVELVIL